MKMAYLQLTFLLQEKGLLEESLRVFEAADRNGAGGESMDRRRAMLLAEIGRAKEASALLERYEKTDDPDTLDAIGIALTESGRPQEALPFFERALQIDVKNAQAHQDAALALLQLEHVDEARQHAETAIAISPKSARAFNVLGVIASRLGDPKKAVASWSRAVELSAKQYDALYNLGRTAGSLGDFDLARKSLERFEKTAPPARYRKDLVEVRAVLAEMKRVEARGGKR